MNHNHKPANRFSELISNILGSSKNLRKSYFFSEFLNSASELEKIWAVYILSGGKIEHKITRIQLKQWLEELVDIPKWLLKSSASQIGDSGETMQLMLSNTTILSLTTHKKNKVKHVNLFENIDGSENVIELSPQDLHNADFKKWLRDIRSLSKEKLRIYLTSLSREDAYVFAKLVTGRFRLGFAKQSLISVLAKHLKVDKQLVELHLQQIKHPDSQSWADLTKQLRSKSKTTKNLLPYPFCLAAPLDLQSNKKDSIAYPLDISQHLIEWKWDGIRCQIVSRQKQVELWSRSAGPITNSFPELRNFVQKLSQEFILDGEIVALRYGYDPTRPLSDQIASFNRLQTRLNRNTASLELTRRYPVIFIAYDLLELNGKSIINHKLTERRYKLEKLISQISSSRIPQENKLKLSETLDCQSIADIDQYMSIARDMGTEGLMLKHKQKSYVSGRKIGVWWKHKLEPFSLDLVLTFAQLGTGKRASLFSDYTFAARQSAESQKLVTITKAYSGLSNDEISELTSWIKKNTQKTFGPVRQVIPTRVFEIGFEGIAHSTRHRSGYALRFPRILRERPDKSVADANSIEDAAKILYIYNRTQTASVKNSNQSIEFSSFDQPQLL